MSDKSLAETWDEIPVLDAETPPHHTPVNVDFAGLTHVGKVRKNNEDNFHIVQFGRYLRTMASSLPAGVIPEEVDQPGYGYAIADGVGGAAAGEVASRMAIKVLVELVLETPDWILGREDHLIAKVMDRTAQRFQAVNEAVIKQSRNEPGLDGMGTTLSLAISLGNDLLVTHVGDSPVMLFHNGRLQRLTRDHTVGQLWRNVNSAKAARFRNVLTHAIGLPETGGEPDIYRYKLADGDRLLLCTDGLTDMVDNDTIAAELGRGSSAAETCLALVNLALDRGGRDNVTVIVATYRLPKEP